MKYDIIGDIHGYAGALDALLTKLGYVKNEEGVYQPPEPNRQALFIGDFIDRGPENFRVLETVQNMVEAGHARP